ncbi:hypothetical protein HHE02_09490 [Helicobacter heilmannii]|nr:hypothetical protein HHE02_09490 [Helicobacter heilmannii]CRF49614.1 hypothetical protein HHE03_12400 [Helicobacter heilmannii]
MGDLSRRTFKPCSKRFLSSLWCESPQQAHFIEKPYILLTCLFLDWK